MKSLNEWIFLRDGVFYILGLAIIITFYLNEEFNWYTGFIPIIYYVLYYLSISRNEQLKETCFKLLGITNEDDEFDAEDHLHLKKRRHSIRDLVRNNMILDNDEMLNNRIGRQRVLLKIKLKDKAEKLNPIFNF